MATKSKATAALKLSKVGFKVSISDKIYIGTCVEDYDIQTHWSQEKQDLYAPPDNSDLHGLKNRQLWTNAIAEGTAWPNKVDIHRPHDDNSKKQNINY